MTIIAGFSYALFSVIVADSRLSANVDGRMVSRDVAQKMFPLAGAGIVCWAGWLNTARPLVRRLRARTATDGPWWLLDEREVRATLLAGYERLDAKSAGVPQVSFIAQVMNPSRRSFADEEWPRIDMVVVDFDPFSYEIVPYGARIRGSGKRIEPSVEEMNLWLGVSTFSGASPDLERAVINKSLLAQTMTENLIREAGETTVGGLYQVGYVMAHGARVLSYKRWVPVAEHFGTWVQMGVVDGDFWQEHVASGRKSRLMDPFAENVETEFARDLVFDAAKLPIGSPGVVAAQNPQHWAEVITVHGVDVAAPIPAMNSFAKPLGPEGMFTKFADIPPVGPP